MATGFGTIQRNTVSTGAGYQTLFEKINAKAQGQKKTLTWYRNAVKSEASSYRKNFDKYIFCLLYTSPSPRDADVSRMPSSA